MVVVGDWLVRVMRGAVREFGRGGRGVTREGGAYLDLSGGRVLVAGGSEDERLENAFQAGRQVGRDEALGRLPAKRFSGGASRCAGVGRPPGLLPRAAGSRIREM